MSLVEIASAFNSRLVSSRDTQRKGSPRRVPADAKAVIATLREFAPYAVIVLPGGSVMALLWWLYRRLAVPSSSRRRARR